MDFFKKKKSLSQVITEAKSKLLTDYEINKPNEAQEFKAIFYLVIAAIGVINSMQVPKAQFLIDDLAKSARHLTQNLAFQISEITQDPDELKDIFSHLPENMAGGTSIRVNGLVVLPTLFNTRGYKLVKEISENTDGDFGSTGWAAVVVGDGLVGRENAGVFYLDTVHGIMNLMKEIFESE